MSVDTRLARPVPPSIWRPCPTCWGQRRIHENRYGEGLLPMPCPGCLGIGEALAVLG